MSLGLLSASQALNRLLSLLEPLTAESVPLRDCLGGVLAEDVLAPINLPPFTNSAMDGYAVRSEDLAQASSQTPTRLRVIGEVAAGIAPLREMERGETMHITTGAPLPPAADSIVPVEDTSSPGPMAGQPLPEHVEACAAVRPGQFVRASGQDVSAGSVVLRAGRRLRPQDVALLAALGVSRPTVRRRAHVAILSTGDELREVDQPLSPGFIHDANGPGLAAAVQQAGAIPVYLGIVADEDRALVEALGRAVQAEADLILTSAGVSMGPMDFVRPTLEEHGHLEFWRINMRPGKPLAVGTYKGIPFLGLPGNPVSAMVAFEVFVRPAIRRLHGMTDPGPLRVLARLDHRVESDGRESYLRAEVRWQDDEYRARLSGGQESNVLSALAAANALVILPAGVRSAEPGEMVEAWFLDPILVL